MFIVIHCTHPGQNKIIVTIFLILAPDSNQDPTNDPNAKQMTVAKFVELLKVLENAFPDVPPGEMVHKLRMLVPRYDSTVWKVSAVDIL